MNPEGYDGDPDQWSGRYRRAWETADADEVVDQFTPDASYRSSVLCEPYLGSDTICPISSIVVQSHRTWPIR
jgi:hypothetical protein